MDERLKGIVVHVFYEEREHVLRTYPNEYRSLMHLITDKLYTESFGECLGMGKCGTCLIEIIEAAHSFSLYERNENTTLSRQKIMEERIRLSCQIIADENINGLKINIVE